jgi:inosose dehydratase
MDVDSAFLGGPTLTRLALIPMPAIVSCLTNSYGGFGARAAIERLRDAGLEYVELPIRTAGVPSVFGDEPLVTTASTPSDLKQVDDLLHRHGVRVASCNVTSGNPLDPEVVATVKRKLELAAYFGVSLVVGGAGEAEDADQLETLYDHLREIGDYAGRLGITYCFETHPGLCQDHHGMLRTMGALAHPHLKLNFDTANIFYYNENVNGEIALAKVCQHVRHMHLKDSHGEFGRWYFPALGYGGAVDFARVLQLMRGCGFAGPYSLEIEGIASEGQLSLADHHRRVVQSVQHLKSCGYFD